MWNWILTLILGTGAAVTPTPVNLPKGSTYFAAPKALSPVNDTMRVGIDLGNATESMKKAVLDGKLKLSDIGDIKVELCRSQTDCLTMSHSGTYFTRDKYGIGFQASGPEVRRSSFSGVRVSSDRPLGHVTINWSNFVQ